MATTHSQSRVGYAPAPGTYALDSTHSYVSFTARHLMVTKVRGRFPVTAGELTIGEDPSQSSVTATIDLSAVESGDPKRDEHLRSADFFDAANYPTMHFVSKQIVGDVTKDFQIIGDLTIRGTTHEVGLDAHLEGRGKDPWGNERAGFSLSGKVNRHDYGLQWNQALEAGGVAVGAEVKITIDVEIFHKIEALSAAA